MDWASLLGLSLAIAGIFLGQKLEGGAISSLLQPAAFLIVVVGTIGAVLLQSTMSSFVLGVRMARWIFFPPRVVSPALTQDIDLWSMKARREGLLSLESNMHASEDPFITKGLRLVVDGIDPVKLRDILDADINAYEMEQRQAVKIWEAAGGYAPTIGILGAVLGLIHVMENLTDPSKLGSGIAVAFVATIYGVGLANLVFLPIGHKLKIIVCNEVSKREMLVDIFLGIANGDNTRLIEERVAGYIR